MQQILDWIKGNKDALDIIFGSGVILTLLGGIYKIITWLVKVYRSRKTRSTENFPFKIIHPKSNVAKEILRGADDDPLADRNIPYQQRIRDKNIFQELRTSLDSYRYLLITGRTGIGKTREAINLAQSLSNEGWTILYLTRDKWLEAPSRLPEGLPDRQLVFLLDDLNRKVYGGHIEQSPKAESPLQSMNIPFQERLYQTLETFEILCGMNEIRVIATARSDKVREFTNEPSEWEKLEIDKYVNFWRKFKIDELANPNDEAIINLLKAISPKLGIKLKPRDYNLIARRNDGTFSNIVVNLIRTRNNNTTLEPENFSDSLKKTWERRFQDAVIKHRSSKYIYKSIQLLINREINLSTSAIKIIANRMGKIAREKFSKRDIKASLDYLISREDILHPRDGQLEASGPTPDWKPYFIPLIRLKIDLYLPNYRLPFGIWLTLLLYDLPLIRSIILDPSKTRKGLGTNKRMSEFWREIGSFYELIDNHEALVMIKNSLQIDSTLPENWIALGKVYAGLNQFAPALSAYQKALKLSTKKISPSIWHGLGGIYVHLGKYDDAASAINKVIELDKKDAEAYTLLGDVYNFQGKHELAIENHLKSIKVKSKFPSWSYRSLGKIYYFDNEHKKAIDAFHKILKHIPYDIETNIALSVHYKKTGQKEDLEKHLELANLFINSEKSILNYNLACIESINGNVEKAMKFLKVALRKKEVTLDYINQDLNSLIIREHEGFNLDAILVL